MLTTLVVDARSDCGVLGMMCGWLPDAIRDVCNASGVVSRGLNCCAKVSRHAVSRVCKMVCRAA